MTRRSAFSLLEMMLVVVIIGLLAGVVTVSFLHQGKKARVELTKVEMKSVRDAVESYMINTGSLPATLEELLSSSPPYIRSLPKDAWKRPFIYRPEPANPERQYTLVSLGEDGVEGTDDDLDLWQIEQEEG